MKTNWVRRLRHGLLFASLMGAGIGLVGCADEYAAYPGYRGGYYASYSAGYPYYNAYGYPYRPYGPYYGRPYYGSPYYGASTVVVSRSGGYGYRDQYGRWHNRRQVNRNTNRTRSTTTRAHRTRTQVESSDNDDENRYYNRQRP